MTKQEKEDASVYALIAAMASNTGMHGLPNVGRSQHTVRKIFWMLTFLAGAGKSSWFIFLVQIIKYTPGQKLKTI